MRTTHFTGTTTDIGLLIGQIYPNNVKNAAHFWKLKILTGLVVTWIVAGAVSLPLDCPVNLYRSLYLMSTLS